MSYNVKIKGGKSTGIQPYDNKKIKTTEEYVKESRELAMRDCTEVHKEGLLSYVGQGKTTKLYALENGLQPSRVQAWLYYDEDLRTRLQLAQETGHLARFEEIESLSDEALEQIQSLKEDTGLHKYAQVLLNAYDLQINTKKWALAKINPRRYSEKMDVTSGGKAIGGNTIVFAEFHKDAPPVVLNQNENKEYEAGS